MKNIIIDFEFTWLDNNYITDNEIIWMSYMDIDTKESKSFIFSSEKKNAIGSYLVNRITPEEQNGLIKFSKEFFEEIFGKDFSRTTKFYFFSASQDVKMLKKYGIHIGTSYLIDVQDEMRRCDDYEYTMAREGSSLECCYYMIMWEELKSLHTETNEVKAIYEMIAKMKNIECRSHYTVYPWGAWAGMPLDDFCIEYRRNADWYRYNNVDTLASSLDYYCSVIDEAYDYSDDDEEFDD